MSLKKKLNNLNEVFEKDDDYDVKMQAIYNVKKEMTNKKKKFPLDESDIKLNAIYECVNIKKYYPDEELYIMGAEHKLGLYKKIHILCDETNIEFLEYVKKKVDGATVTYSQYLSFEKLMNDCFQNLDTLYVVWSSSYEQSKITIQRRELDNLFVVDEFMKCAMRKTLSEGV